MKLSTVMMIVSALLFLACIVVMWRGVRRETRPHREYIDGLVKQARRIAEEESEDDE